MYEVTIKYGNENGDGVESVLVDIEEGGFDTVLYQRVIQLAVADFASKELWAIIDSVRVRQVPNRVIRASNSISPELVISR